MRLPVCYHDARGVATPPPGASWHPSQGWQGVTGGQSEGWGGLGHPWLDCPLPRPPSGTEQMLSHGTADVVLEACTDFWDGADIYPLSGSDR